MKNMKNMKRLLDKNIVLACAMCTLGCGIVVAATKQNPSSIDTGVKINRVDGDVTPIIPVIDVSVSSPSLTLKFDQSRPEILGVYSGKGTLDIANKSSCGINLNFAKGRLTENTTAGIDFKNFDEIERAHMGVKAPTSQNIAHISYLIGDSKYSIEVQPDKVINTVSKKDKNGNIIDNVDINSIGVNVKKGESQKVVVDSKLRLTEDEKTQGINIIATLGVVIEAEN